MDAIENRLIGSTTHRFVGSHNGVPFVAAFVFLVLMMAVASWGEHLTGQTLVLAAIVILALMSPMFVWIMCQLQDIVTYDSDTKTLRVLRRRALIPDAVYDYTAGDVRSVSISRVVGECEDAFFARVRMADRRQFRFTHEHADATLVAEAARDLLSALGRSDDVPILYYDNLQSTSPTLFSDSSVGRRSASA